MGRVFASECSQFKYINSATKCCNKKKPNFPIVTKKKPRQFLLKTATFQISPKSHYKVLTIFCKIICGHNLVALVPSLHSFRKKQFNFPIEIFSRSICSNKKVLRNSKLHKHMFMSTAKKT